jgi:hypothetical protein
MTRTFFLPQMPSTFAMKKLYRHLEEAVSSPRRSYIVTSEKLMAGWCQREGAP